jgi:hypothetical protein
MAARLSAIHAVRLYTKQYHWYSFPLEANPRILNLKSMIEIAGHVHAPSVLTPEGEGIILGNLWVPARVDHRARLKAVKKRSLQ